MTFTIFDMPRTDRIVSGPGSRRQVVDELDRIGAQRVAIISSLSVSKLEEHQELRDQLGSRVAMEFTEVKPHPPTKQVVDLIGRSAGADPDAYVAVGAGSVVDSAKFAALGVAENITTVEDLVASAARARVRHQRDGQPGERRVAPGKGVASPPARASHRWPYEQSDTWGSASGTWTGPSSSTPTVWDCA
jgi:alcohol dehydrogenase class IV